MVAEVGRGNSGSAGLKGFERQIGHLVEVGMLAVTQVAWVTGLMYAPWPVSMSRVMLRLYSRFKHA